MTIARATMIYVPTAGRLSARIELERILIANFGGFTSWEAIGYDLNGIAYDGIRLTDEERVTVYRVLQRAENYHEDQWHGLAEWIRVRFAQREVLWETTPCMMELVQAPTEVNNEQPSKVPEVHESYRIER